MNKYNLQYNKKVLSEIRNLFSLTWISEAAFWDQKLSILSHYLQS